MIYSYIPDAKNNEVNISSKILENFSIYSIENPKAITEGGLENDITNGINNLKIKYRILT